MRAYAFAAVALALLARRSVLAESESDDGNEGGGSAAVVRPAHDVVCSLNVSKSRTVQPGATLTARLVVRSKGTRRDGFVSASVHADSATGAVLWSGTLDLRLRRRATRKLRLDVPSSATSLVAVATSDQDENPGNNVDVVSFAGGSDSGGDGSSGGVPPVVHSASAVLGAATFAANCASCHGAGAQGTNRAPRILGRSAGDVYEAMREGDDGMPRFSEMTMQDAKNLAAFLADPSAATSPPPVTPPPSGSAPTYSGQIEPLLAASCTACHAGTSAPLGIRLDTYATAGANASAALAAIQAGRMPPGGALPPASVALFADWVNGGLKQ